MPLNEIKKFELICDKQKSSRCRGSDNQHPTLTAYSIKSAHKLIREAGWKVNDGSRSKPATYECPMCRVTK